jgi:RNA polymerase primary sigma factor
MRSKFEDYNSLNCYLNEIHKIPCLTIEEEKELGIKVREGDKNALDKLVRSNLRFVISVAKHYSIPGFTLLDVINEGNLGLIKAAEKYDPCKGKFSTYAVHWIRQTILKAFQEKSRLIRLPAQANNMINYSRRWIEYFGEDIFKLAEEMNLPTKDLEGLLSISKTPASLDSSISEDEHDEGIGQYFESPYKDSFEEIINNDYLRQIRENMRIILTKREMKIIEYRFGLNGNEEKTLADIGEIFHVTRERVRQIEEKAIKKLRNPSMKNINSYLLTK